MEFDLDLSESAWFPYFESHLDSSTGEIVYHDPIDPGVRVKIRSLKPFIEERLQSSKVEKEFVLNPKTHAMEKVSSFKERTFQQVMEELDAGYDYAITALEGFTDKKTKNAIECTKANKAALRRIAVFARFFDRCQEIIDGAAQAHFEEERKN